MAYAGGSEHAVEGLGLYPAVVAVELSLTRPQDHTLIDDRVAVDARRHGGQAVGEVEARTTDPVAGPEVEHLVRLAKVGHVRWFESTKRRPLKYVEQRAA